MATRNPSLNIIPDLARKAGLTSNAGGLVDDELIGARGDWWYTGKHPEQCPGYDAKHGVLRSLALPSTNGCTRQQVLDYFDNCWTLTEVLFASLQGAETFVRQPYHQLRHPMIFYYGHTAVLYVNKLRVAGLLQDGIDQFIEQLFETGVDEMSWDDLSRARDDWPSVRTMHEYRQQSYALLRNLFETHPCLEGPANWDNAAWAVFMGFEHERIHIETSSVLIRELPLHCVRKPEYWPAYHPSCTLPSPHVPTPGEDFPANPLLSVAGGKVVLGKHIDYPSFGWDNEYGCKKIDVPAFRASKFKVTNGEFLAFVKASGYANPRYWSQDGWGWKTFRNVKWPTFWVPDGPQGLHRYKLRCLFDAVEMPWSWPVDVNYHEAKAYCAWKAEQDGQLVRYRIVTEAEHMLLRNKADRADAYPGADTVTDALPAAAADPAANPDLAMACSGADALVKVAANLQLAHGSQSPVDALPATEKGFHDVMGNAWEWGDDHYAAYPGFKVHPFYEDFSAPCFGGLHQMIIGGSFVSTGQLASKFARYQFRPHFFQHASFRIVQSVIDESLYNTAAHSAQNPIQPYFETSCMDCAPPHVGDGPCCSKDKRARFTPTMADQAKSHEAKLATAQSIYESDFLMGQYLSLHFGPMKSAFRELAGETGLLAEAMDFPKKCGELVNKWAQQCGVKAGRALDVGCAVGGSSFEMAKVFGEVVGFDISNTFIDKANEMKSSRQIGYKLKVEGDIVEELTATIGSDVPAERTRFVQGDACAFPSGLGTFDALLAANLLCRVPNPAAFFDQADAHLAPGGLLVLTSPFTWMEEYTDKAGWVGATYDAAGQPRRCADALKQILAGKGYEILDEGRIPLVIRETCRKYQLILAHRLVARKRSA